MGVKGGQFEGGHFMLTLNLSEFFEWSSLSGLIYVPDEWQRDDRGGGV